MQNGAVSYGRDIYESLAEYITDERYHQAVLLNGSWRSGKTWFIKEEFIPAFEQNHEEDGWCFVYLSLYGLKTVQQLEAKMRQAVTQRLLVRYFARTGATPKETEKFFGIAKNAAGVVSSLAAFASKMFLPIQDLPDVKWCNLQKVLPKPERMVYIIDDLERAGMEAEEVLGYINEMTEHEAAKVIILANEEEIYRINDFTKSLQKKKQNADPKETAGNARRERYERIKEKTIGLDIAYQVSVVDIYDSLIERYVKSQLMDNSLAAVVIIGSVVGWVVSIFCIMDIRFFHLWLGKDFSQYHFAILFLILPLISILTTSQFHVILQALNKLVPYSIATIMCGIISIAAMYLLGSYLGWGRLGIIIGCNLMAFIQHIFVLPHFVHTYLQRSMKKLYAAIFFIQAYSAIFCLAADKVNTLFPTGGLIVFLLEGIVLSFLYWGILIAIIPGRYRRKMYLAVAPLISRF